MRNVFLILVAMLTLASGTKATAVEVNQESRLK